ncbi:MAG TPA: peptide MFS transporter [Xanthobacteraceae bacterium]|jgi:POT family proton-dependent oligopeptide transporter|nr:peptide MFS transporter [Xanthobacteraceae bacterium]
MAVSSVEPKGRIEPGADLFGHPRGLTFLFGTEMWERFSYYGMRALLVLYMVKYLLLPGTVENVIGFAATRHALEWLFGPLDIQPLASQIYGLYTALVYLTPLLGGLLADRVLGQRRTVVLGATLMAIGHFMMAFEPLFLFALLTLILGNGAFKPNISTQVGGLYAPGDARRDRAYSVFYVGINLGAFLAPLVCGTLGERAGWHYGFAAAGVGMLVGLAIYLYARPMLPPDTLKETRERPAGEPLTRSERQSIAALVALFVPVTFFWATYEQQGNTIALWADAFTDRSVDLVFWHGDIPTTWFQAFNPFMIFAFTPLVVALWGRQAARGTEPSSVTKMALGCFGIALANLILVIAASRTGADGRASWLWLFGFFAVLTVGELYLSPVGLSLVSKVAPASVRSMLMGFWLATSFTGNFLAGYIGSLWSGMDKSHFFLLVAAIAAAAGAVIWAIGRPLKPVLEA